MCDGRRIVVRNLRHPDVSKQFSGGSLNVLEKPRLVGPALSDQVAHGRSFLTPRDKRYAGIDAGTASGRFTYFARSASISRQAWFISAVHSGPHASRTASSTIPKKVAKTS